MDAQVDVGRVDADQPRVGLERALRRMASLAGGPDPSGFLLGIGPALRDALVLSTQLDPAIVDRHFEAALETVLQELASKR